MEDESALKSVMTEVLFSIVRHMLVLARIIGI
jgi:hypothetical protein